MDGLGPGVLVLAGRGERHREHFAAGAGLHQVDGRIFHRQPAAQIAVDPFHQRVAVGHGPLGDQVVDIVGPVLDRGVADPRPRLAITSTTAEWRLSVEYIGAVQPST